MTSGNLFGWRSLIGVLLLVGGGLLLAQATGWLNLGDWLWGAAAIVAAILFVLFWLRDRAQWWVFIPAGALLGIAAVVLASVWRALIRVDDEAVGLLFLVFLGLGFGFSYVANRVMWWALIPMGAMWTTAAVAWLDLRDGAGEPTSASVMFFGMAVTFLLVAVAPGAQERLRPWALIPATLLAVIGVLVAGSYTSILNLIGPLTLMAIGIVLLLNVIFRRRS